MPATKDRKRNKLLKIDVSSDSDSAGSEHELSYHAKDKVKLMKEVLKLIKPKKIKSMAPDCIKDLDIVDINSMLLEELLGISNKRLQYIFNGENVERETSSSESEEEKQPIDVISLDDISDDDIIELSASHNEKYSSEPDLVKKNKNLRISQIKNEVDTIKLEKPEKSKKEIKKKPKNTKELKNKDQELKEADKDKLMSVLELLELQARARAIRSQLAIETEKKKEPESVQNTNIKKEEESDSDAVIIESPQHKEIVINSSDTDEESCSKIPLPTGQTESSSSISELLQQPNSESIMVPPQKKQKHISNKTTEINNQKKKDKLLAKIQKIKLIRNKTTPHKDLNTDTHNSNVETIKPIDNECNTKTSTDNCTVTSQICSKINELNQENVLENIAKSETQPENNGDTKPNNSVNDVKSDTIEEIRSEDSFCNLMKASPKEIHKKIATYCDNDEIVINLDEDEMDGIEND